MTWISLCGLDELAEGRGKYVEVEGFKLVVFMDQGKVYVMDNRCPHAGGSLAAGKVENGCAVCPWHHWAFRLEDGTFRGSKLIRVDTYKVRLANREGQPPLVQAELPMY